MADADFYLGEQDTAPVLELVCLGPDLTTPVDLTGATVTFQIRPEDESSVSVTASCTVVNPGTLGKIQFNWVGYAPGRYDGRVKATLASGKRMSFPNDRPIKIEITADP